MKLGIQKAFIIFSILLMASCSVNKKAINVAGIGTVTFVPDMVVMSITVKNSSMELHESLSQTKETILGILNVCKNFGIEDIDIKSSRINTNKEYLRENNQTEPKFIGYSTTQTTQIVYRDISKFEELSEEILNLNITSINQVTFDHSKKTEFKAEADLLALDDAKQSAQKIADIMGVKLGKILYISNTSISPEPFVGLDYQVSYYQGNRSTGIISSPGILSESKNVQVVYEIR